MSDKPKRSWFRFHLLTAVLMMVAAGGMLWVNFDKRDSYTLILDVEPMPADEKPAYEIFKQGWPLVWRERSDDGYVPRRRMKRAGTPFYVDPSFAVAVTINILVAAGIILAAAFVSESLIRRREGRKP